MIESEASAPSFGFAQLKRLLKFGVVGASGVVVNLAVFESILWSLGNANTLEWRMFWANIVGIALSIFWNFLLNDRWTWSDRSKGGRAEWFKRLAKYYFSASVAGTVQVIVTQLSFNWVWSHLDLSYGSYEPMPAMSVLTGIGFGMVINFLASHLWAFRDA